MIIQQLAEQVSLKLRLPYRGMHAFAFCSRPHPHELPRPVNVDLAGDAFGLDDEHPVAVDDKVVDLGHLARSFEANVVKHKDVGTAIPECAAQIERHISLCPRACLCAHALAQYRISILDDHAPSGSYGIGR